MRKSSFLVTKSNFYVFIFKVFPDFNMENTEYIERIKESFFSTHDEGIPYSYVYDDFKKHMKGVYGFSTYSKSNEKYWILRGYTNKSKRAQLVLLNFAGDKDTIALYNDIESQKRVFKKCFEVFNFDNIEYFKDIMDFVFDNKSTINQNEMLLGCQKYFSRYNLRYSTTSKEFFISRGYSEDDAINLASHTQKSRSFISLEHYKELGISEEEAKVIISQYQSKISSYSKNTRKYWLNLGFDEENALKLSKKCGRASSVRCDEYWIKQGYSPVDAHKKALEYNPSSETFIGYNGDATRVYTKRKTQSEKKKSQWKSNAEKYAMALSKIRRGPQISKEENECFEFLKYHFDAVHEPYIVLIPDDYVGAINKYFYSCDGYVRVKNGVIVIEYDGVVYHNQELDLVRDSNILDIDKSIVGIIRIKQSFKKKTVNDKIKLFAYGIQKIENSEESRVIIF